MVKTKDSQEKMTLTKERIQEKISKLFGTSITGWEENYGMLSCTINPQKNLEIATKLFNDDELKFKFLTDITAVHYPDRKDEELCIITHLHNLEDNIRLRLKSYVPISQPETFSLVPLFAGANWMERETFDFFGVNFVGHPNLKRILNADEMSYHPMRKEYPMEDPTRTDKDNEMFGRG